MPSSFMSWDACRNIRHHGTSRESECADCSIRKTKILKSSSFQNFTPSPDKIRIRKHSFLLPLSGACYNCRVRVAAERDAFWERRPQQDYFPANLSRVAGRRTRDPPLRAGPGQVEAAGNEE